MLLTPLEALYDLHEGEEGEEGADLPLPPELAALYGSLRLPSHPGRPYVLGNFVTTLDGVVSLQAPGQKGGGEISGNNRHDHAIMGLLRALADAIIIGAGTLRDSPGHRWTPAQVAPAYADAFRQLHTMMSKPETPLNVFVTSSGSISLSMAALQSAGIPVLIVTTTHGAQRISEQQVPPWVQMREVEVNNEGFIEARSILEAVNQVRHCEVILTEGGPRLIGNFLAGHALDELFLTLAPQIAGRDDQAERPGLVTGYTFAPQHPLWSRLVSVKRAESHLFLRYRFRTGEA
jgi:riboflavin biosynthesis pyrimidine reductase